MNNHEQHQMVVKNTYPTGVQEYFCPTCGRHFVVQYPPKYRRIIFDEGDPQAAHSGGSGGVVMGSANVSIEPNQLPPDDQPGGSSSSSFGGSGDEGRYLSPWERWMDNHEF